MTHISDNNPFGAAKPREEILASKGVDYHDIERKLDEKAHGTHVHLTTHPSYHPHINPFGDAKPREEVLASRKVDNGKQEDRDVAGHHSNPVHAQRVQTTNLLRHNHPKDQIPPVVTPSSSSENVERRSSEKICAKKSKKKINPFGSARPREEVLAEHGVDYHTLDQKVDRKIEAERLTFEQSQQAEAIRLQLTKAEEAYWDANENEMPEETFRVEVDRLRKELHDLLEQFQEMNLKQRLDDKQKEGNDKTQKEEKSNEDNDAEHVNVNTTKSGEKTEYHFQRRPEVSAPSTRNMHHKATQDEDQDYHGGDARRYCDVEIPSYARRGRYNDHHPYDHERFSGGDGSRSAGDNHYERRGGYYRGGRGRGGRGGRGSRYGCRGRGEGGGERYYHRSNNNEREEREGYGGGGHRSPYDDRRGQQGRYHRSGEHWALCD